MPIIQNSDVLDLVCIQAQNWSMQVTLKCMTLPQLQKSLSLNIISFCNFLLLFLFYTFFFLLLISDTLIIYVCYFLILFVSYWTSDDKSYFIIQWFYSLHLMMLNVIKVFVFYMKWSVITFCFYMKIGLISQYFYEKPFYHILNFSNLVNKKKLYFFCTFYTILIYHLLSAISSITKGKLNCKTKMKIVLC